jgi:glutamate N-acetyltransferase/amino-acid N-acetyltransferase
LIRTICHYAKYSHVIQLDRVDTKGIDLSVTAAKGFVAGATAAGIRRRAMPDLALVHSTTRATGAAMFTVNQAQAAPVRVSRRHLAVAEPQAVVINSGVANAATGPQGDLDAVLTATETARLLGLDIEEVLVLSTGLIGAKLPMARVMAGLETLAPGLSADGGQAAAEAIMTTDTHPKTSVVGAGAFTVGGMAKGAGMIHPMLATMLAVVTTDYALGPGEAIGFLRPAVEESFNRITVDGECSTNDTVVLLANGAAGAPRDDEAFAAALHEVCSDLARQIVSDGEGASMLIEVAVSGARSSDDALAIADRVARSALVKTAAFGRDPNWGRVVAAAGAASTAEGPVGFDLDTLTVAFNGTKVLTSGRPTQGRPDLTSTVLTIDVDLGLGSGSARYLSSDLSYEYVRINSEYST